MNMVPDINPFLEPLLENLLLLLGAKLLEVVLDQDGVLLFEHQISRRIQLVDGSLGDRLALSIGGLS